MDRDFELETTAACIDIVERGTTTLADGFYELPTTTYTDDDVFRREVTDMFRRVPLIAGLSVELKNAGDWKTFAVRDIDILLTRQEDGTVAAFLNVCRHRGVPVAFGRGSARRLTCRFHGWTYDLAGELVGVPFAEGFEGMCRADKGLVPVPVSERHGMIFVVADHEAGPIDLDAFLGDFGAELDHWNLDSLTYVEHRDHDLEANWKIALDTYGEGYHIQFLHKAAVDAGLVTQIPNRVLFNSFGDDKFHRNVFPFEGIDDFKGRPQEEWNAFDAWQMAFTYVLFPNTVMVFLGDHVQLFQLMPGQRISHSLTTQTLFALDEHLSQEQFDGMQASFDLIYDVVANEDYWASRQAQVGLGSGANDVFVFGRNEPLLHKVHDQFRRYLGQEPVEPRVASPVA